jgi:hypothetical protein
MYNRARVQQLVVVFRIHLVSGSKPGADTSHTDLNLSVPPGTDIAQIGLPANPVASLEIRHPLTQLFDTSKPLETIKD